jgi:hypothetical protein
MSNPQEIREEQIQMMRLRLRVDLTCHRLRTAALTRQQALALIEQTREDILTLFPDKADVFDLVLRPRFMRLINERVMTDWGVLDAMN